MIPIVVVACLATVALSAPTDPRPTTVIVEGPEGRLLQAEEPGKGLWGYITSETADGQFQHKTIDGKTLASSVNQLPISPALLPAVYPYPMSFVPGYGFRYFPENYFPAYYPAYAQGQYDLDGIQLTKADVENQSDAIDQLITAVDDNRPTSSTTPVAAATSPTNPLAPFFTQLTAIVDSTRGIAPGTTPSSTPGGGGGAAAPTNPLAPFLNLMITMNNINMAKLFFSNALMLIAG